VTAGLNVWGVAGSAISKSELPEMLTVIVPVNPEGAVSVRGSTTLLPTHTVLNASGFALGVTVPAIGCPPACASDTMNRDAVAKVMLKKCKYNFFIHTVLSGEVTSE
jgi:hypothetical protein